MMYILGRYFYLIFFFLFLDVAKFGINENQLDQPFGVGEQML